MELNEEGIKVRFISFYRFYVTAMEFIHNQLVEKRNAGDGVLLVSSELSEIMSLSDRIYVIYEGKMNGEFRRGTIDEKELGLYMLGGKKYEDA